ncbi:recombinase family protein [Radiobacillus deserti]|uniref:Recombinase family protein n=1 Tax=Radiobacillus deserti TaxID=2594883 RepID=A0A516KHD1_9BACI|nr:recombinase family protein [Radiobacillus deserti]QDP40787.1 recombinase family protein [Radiobacillus deserti]
MRITQNEEVSFNTYKEYPYIVYVRVSTDKDEQKDSIGNQIDICRYWLEENHFEWNESSILKDEGKSGTLFLERTAMQLILQKARNREIKMVVFKSITRLARDLKDALEIKEILIGHGVRVVTMEEGYDSLYEGKNDMKFEMYSMFAAQYPKTQSVSISAALAAKVRRGDHIGKIPYGYDRIDQKLVIKEEEAKVIRQIFHWYNYHGYGMKTIVRMLNEGVENGEILPPRNKKHWQITSVQRILRNPTFCGTFILNQYTTIKVDGKKKQIKNPEEKWNVFEDHHPAIVSKDEWEKANNRKNVNSKKKFTPWNDLRGLLKCGKCGSNMVIVQGGNKKDGGHWRYLKCSAYRRSGKYGCVNHVPITYESFKELIVNQLQNYGIRVAELNLINNLENTKEQQVRNIKKRIDSLEDKKVSLLDLYLDKLINKAEFQRRNNQLDSDLKKANDQLFLLNKEETRQSEIKSILDAFNSLENSNENLHHVFKTLLKDVIIEQTGEIEINYAFENSK